MLIICEFIRILFAKICILIRMESIPLVAASETGTAQTLFFFGFIWRKVRGCKVAASIYFGKARSYMVRRTVLERPAKEGDSPVNEN